MDILHGEAVAACFKYFILDKDLKNEVIKDLKNYIDLEMIDNFIKNNKEQILENIKNDKKVINSFNVFIKEIFLNWGIKVLLVVVTIFVTSTIFGVKFRKIKHGI